MITNDYISIVMFDSGLTNEFEIGKYFNLDVEKYNSLEDYSKAVQKLMHIDSDYRLPDNGLIKFEGRVWSWDKTVLNSNVQQWAKMHEVLASSTGLIDLRLIAIYFRPIDECFNPNRIDDLAIEIGRMPCEIFIALNNFFFSNATTDNCHKCIYIEDANTLSGGSQMGVSISIESQ